MKKLINTLIIMIGLIDSIYGQTLLFIPDTLSGTNFNLTVKCGTVNFYPGFVTNTMGVNSNYLGPTLILRKGEHVQMNVTNSLTDTTTIHWHGMHVAPENDGGPHTVILPGTTWQPQFTVMDNAATYWYHPHLHKKTNEHVTKGAAGFIIVRDDNEAKLKLPRKYGIDDFPIVVQSRAFDANKQFLFKSALDSVIFVNGTKNPYLQVPSQVVRLRLLNGSTERTYNFGLKGNKSFDQIAGDGGLLNVPILLTRLRLAPGERAEILVDFSSMQGQTTYLMSYASELPNGIIGARQVGTGINGIPNYSNNKLNGADFNILRIDVIAPTVNPITTIPTSLTTNIPWDTASVNTTRILTFTSAGGMMNVVGPFLIDGASFNMNKINYNIPLNNVEIWELRNQTLVAHPFHIHDVQFYLLDRNGSAVPSNEKGRKDVVLVLPLETVRFITKFENFSNSMVPYMYHCHMLTHEDDGMMGQFLVTSITGINKNEIVPTEFKLEQNYPNPFNPSTTIAFMIPENQNVSLDIYDILGRHVQTLVNQQLPQGSYSVEFNAGGLVSGVYLFRIQAGRFTETKKMIKLK